MDGENKVVIPVVNPPKAEKEQPKASVVEHFGKISEIIGTGEHAKLGIIYLTIRWAFITGCVVSLLVVINYWGFREKEKVPDFVSDIKVIWEVIIPIITLALGYAFGKSKN
jgi:hypothetical protein